MTRSAKQTPVEAGKLGMELDGLRRVAAAAIFLCSESILDDSPTSGHCRFCFQHCSWSPVDAVGIRHLPACPVGLVLTALEETTQGQEKAGNQG